MIWHNISVNEVTKNLMVSLGQGLSDIQVKERVSTYGQNVLRHEKKKSITMRFFAQFNDYMIIILLIAAAVSFIVSVMQGDADFADPVIILLIVILNALIGIFQESKAEKALEALKKLTTSKAKVLRNGQPTVINSEDLTVGDIILLKTGDYVPADVRLINSTELKIDESSLTGESLPVDKDHKSMHNESIHIADIKNMIWSSTAVVSGYATGVVVEIGMNTQVGKIAKMIITSETPQTPLQHKLAKTGEALGSIALTICAIIFLMGIMRKIPPFEMFMTSVSLAVAAIPEGLPAIVTIMLAIGVQKMAKKNAIVRKLPAVETLGSASVICSDKTGTLTQNKMTVVEIAGDKNLVLSLATLCNNNNDATENAIFTAAIENKLSKVSLESSFPRISEVPFNSIKKMMTTVHKNSGKYRIIVKGAPDVIINKCSMSQQERNLITEQNICMAKKALRVIGVAYADVDVIPKNPEQNLIFAGLIGIMDPPRPEVKQAVKTCKRAGIKAVMITGDHVETAIAIARDIGIMSRNDKAITGVQLESMSDNELRKNIYDYSVFARVTPKHKVKIVEAFQSTGAVVAMTGDGVNDAPALQKADIGCAMGITGTDVAKGAADMILTDDNFATIVEAIKQGRGIFANIRKSIHFLLSSNIGEILTIFTAMLFGWQSPLIAIQLLWVNLVTDSLPAIALGVDKNDDDIMQCKPIDRKKGMFADGLGLTIALEGIMIGMLALLAFAYGNIIFGDLIVARTMAFCVLSISQLVHSFNVRSEHSLFKIGIFSNKYIVISFIICAFMQILVVMSPTLSSLFKVVPLNFLQWKTVALLSIMPLFVVESVKFLSSIKAKKSLQFFPQSDILTK